MLPVLRLVILNAALALLYFLAGRFGLSLAFLHESASAVWPPTGISIAAVLLFGPTLLPGIFVGAFAVNLGTTASLPVIFGIAAGNTLEAFAGAWFARRIASGTAAFQTASSMIRFFVAAALPATMASATVGVLSLSLGNYAQWENFSSVWMTWWLGDFVSALILCPLLVVWWKNPRPKMPARRIIELACLFLAILLVSQLVFGRSSGPDAQRYPLDFLLIPVLLWAAYRFEQHGASAASLLVSAIAIYATLNGSGPFAMADENTSLLVLQAFMGTITLTSLVLAALVSERRLTDEKRQLYQQIFDKSTDGIAVIHPNGEYFEQNPAHSALLGYDDAALRGQTPEIHLGSRQFTTIVEALRENGVFRGEVTSRRCDGKTVPIEIAAFPVRNEQGQVLYYVGVKRDITDRKQAEASLKEAEAKLRNYAAELESRVAERTLDLTNTVQSLESFCYSIAHDLRAPLRGVNGLSAALLEEYRPKLERAGVDYLERICAAVERMDELIRDLLDYGRISKEASEGEPTDLNAELKAAFSQLQTEIEASKAVIELLSPLPTLPFNRVVISQIFRNLLSNALKFVPPGVTPHLRIWSVLTPQKIEIAFQDNGIGIAPEHQERIFHIFERLHANDSYPGTGIGLAIVKKGMERLGGTVRLESQVGQGTTFWLEFKVKPRTDLSPAPYAI